ncbi:MAG: hypothetical protein LBI28_04135 [Treponema sp.]|nr:hypothetical protein [Treponema sp.]
MELRPKRKILFLALAVCIVFSVVFAEVVIADDLDHDCAGEGCPLCLTIETVHNFIRNLKLGGTAIFLVVCPMFLAQTPPQSAEFAFSLNSPVALKVRFNS